MNIEDIVLCSFQYNEDYTRKVVPFLKPEYFTSEPSKLIYKKINNFFQLYNSLPSKDAIIIDLQNEKMNDILCSDINKKLEEYFSNKNEPYDFTWLLKNTEDWCKDRSLFLALEQSVQIADGADAQLSRTAIPTILSDALSVSFDNNIGHDYFRDANKRFENYKKKLDKLPFGLETFNMITNGGVERKTLNCCLAGTGVGKSIFLCDLAAQYSLKGYNVLYITLELSEEKVAERIDSNLMDINISVMKDIPQNIFEDKLNKMRQKAFGVLKIKEYPTGSASVANFRYLLQEYKLKENFIPDVILVDYMGIMASAKIKEKRDTYMYTKSIAEELRGLAVETKTAIWSAVQSNREGQVASEIDITNTSESMGGPFTFDFFFGIITNDDLQRMDQAMIIQLKSRYGNKDKNRKLNIGLDKNKMRFFDLQNSGQGY